MAAAVAVTEPLLGDQAPPAARSGGGGGGPDAAAAGAAAGQPSEQDLLLSHSTQEAIANWIASCYLALLAFTAAVRSAAVHGAIRKALKPILIAAAAQYAALMALLVPVKILLRIVSLFSSSSSLKAFSSHQVIASSMAIYPMLCVLLTKYVYRSSLADCFFASLREVDPEQAERLARAKPSHKRGMKEKLLSWVTDDSEDPTQMLMLLFVSSLLRSWRSSPLAVVVAPLAEFLSIRYMIGRPWTAAALTALATLHRPAAPLVMAGVEVWCGARALGQSSMRHFLTRAIPRGRQAAFVASFEITIVTYFILPSLLMRAPVGPVLRPFVGPLLVWPAAAVAARCVHDITTRGGSERVVKALQRDE